MSTVSLYEKIEFVDSRLDSIGLTDLPCAAPVLPRMAREPVSLEDIARHIDHTLLAPTATQHDIDRLCAEAQQYGFYSVCVNPVFVSRAQQALAGSPCLVCAVVSFPLGCQTTEFKSLEALEALRNGADELDMVMNIGLLKCGNYRALYGDMRAVVESAGSRPVKVILETSLLDTDEIITACLIARRAGAAFVKTSTGYGPHGAKAEDVMLMKAVVRERMGVKASGGIKDAADARAMLAAGAARLGCSASMAIIAGAHACGHEEEKPA